MSIKVYILTQDGVPYPKRRAADVRLPVYETRAGAHDQKMKLALVGIKVSVKQMYISETP